MNSLALLLLQRPLLLVSGNAEVSPSQASGPVPVESTGRDLADAAASPGHQAFPVLQGANHNTHQPLPWKAMSKLQEKVGKYGLVSAEVMQVLQTLDADPLTPYDIQCLAHVLFRPVEYEIFEYKRTHLADRVIAQNTVLSQQDPRHVIGTDVLMGIGNFADLQRQVAFDYLVFNQCHRMAMAALVQTIEMAAPKESFAAVTQGTHESFLQFAETLTASVERQVEDFNTRQLVRKYLARTNCNAKCRRIIEALPGGPPVSQMAEACAKEQLDQGHLESSTSPWNTPVFCIKKKSGKWRLLQDLWKVNAMMESTGMLQADRKLPSQCQLSTVLSPHNDINGGFFPRVVATCQPYANEWVFLPHQPQKTATALFELIAHLIIKCRQWCLQLMGADPTKIVLPVQQEDFDWNFANSISLQSALENFSGQITYHLPSHKLLQVAKFTEISLRPKISQEPVQGPIVFIDSSGRAGKAIVTWRDGSKWQVLGGHEDGSAQLVALRAAVMAFQRFSQEPFDLVTDSAYVADIAQRLGHSVLKEVSNAALFHLLKTLWCAIQAQVHPYHILHVRSHTNLSGLVAEGNVRADKLVNPAWVASQLDTLVQAKASHRFFHQNAHTLQKQFQLTPTEARDIVESYDDCHALAAPLPAGVNPRGLKALEIWQTDVTQVAKFGRLFDTFSSAMWASAHTGEKTHDVIAYWREGFAVLGVPSAVKTNNGPAYTLQKVPQFLQLWGVSHKFGIPHSPTGQAIVESAHGTLKRVLQKQKQGMQGETPHSRLGKALYIINHLTVPQNSNHPVILNHHLWLQALDKMHKP
ncbi:hypothetical protein DUI87_17734 [Hirundo rustica rustica]|uniref:RNA-directed DNA polymerase n=1 Tax=Hirundo rustica rustica TaxID=333673 RepID=A0A3M0JXL1_HIRRU|nr:hypothetical protein DUI87_17734 [Hirundo rustica rustica]